MQNMEPFGQIVAAVFFANCLCAMLGYYFWHAERAYKEGKSLSNLSWGKHFCGIFPFVIVIIGLYSIG